MLERKTYFIREHVDFLKLSGVYDILDPETQQQIGIAREEISGLLKTLRIFLGKQGLPTKIRVYEGSVAGAPGTLAFSIERPFTWFRAQVKVLDSNGAQLGKFTSKLLSIGGSFTVENAAGVKIADVKGDWKGWNFQFLDSSGGKIGIVTKKWAGIGKELFTTADNYLISLEKDYDKAEATLLLAAGLAIDIVYKEK
jgi:uncharacterized protein YxjI